MYSSVLLKLIVKTIPSHCQTMMHTTLKKPTNELNELISSEKEQMPSATSYSSAFHFLASIQKRLEEQGIKTKKYHRLNYLQ